MKRILTCAVLVSACCTVFAQSHLDEPDYLKDAKPYVPQQNVSGTIRVWGNNYIPALMKQWENGFSKYQPAVQFETQFPRDRSRARRALRQHSGPDLRRT